MAQLQQSSQQQQPQQQPNYHSLLNSVGARHSLVNDSPHQGAAIQQFLQQYDLARLSSLLQSAVGTPTSTLAPPSVSNVPANASGEAPIMYIPVYPSTFAGMNVFPPQDDNGRYRG